MNKADTNDVVLEADVTWRKKPRWMRYNLWVRPTGGGSFVKAVTTHWFPMNLAYSKVREIVNAYKTAVMIAGK
jgi:hypothetical protein